MGKIRFPGGERPGQGRFRVPRVGLVTLLAGCLGLSGIAPASAAVQAWDDGDRLTLSNLEERDEPLVSLEEPLVALVPAPAGALRAVGAGARPALPGQAAGWPDLGRLVARDPRTAERLRQYGPLVSAEALRHGVDAALAQAVVAIESAYNPSARSPRGAIGLMQVLPATAARYGVTRLDDPHENLRAGCLYLRDLLDLFHHDVALAVAAYNAGEHAVQRYGNQVPPYPETQRYVPLVTTLYRGLQP